MVAADTINRPGVGAMPSAEEVARGIAKSTNGKGGKRGSVDNASRLDVFSERTTDGGADWGGCTSEMLLAVVTGITELGGAVTFSLSRNQGAYGLTLLLDKERQTLWFNGDAELDEELEKVIATLDTMK